MKLKLVKIKAASLVMIMLFNIICSSLVFAEGNSVYGQDAENAIMRKKLFVTSSTKNNLNDYLEIAENLTSEHMELVTEVFKTPNKFIYEKLTYNDSNVLLFKTSKSNVNISVTDDLIEVIEQVNESEFLVNGKLIEFHISYEESLPYSTRDWVEINDPGGSWNLVESGWYYYDVSTNFATVSYGVLISIISAAIGGPAGLAISIAAVLGAGAYDILSNSNQGKSYVKEYEHQTLPTIYKKYISIDYVYYDSAWEYMGTETTYYTWIPGGQ
jgi:hypothetical protein